MPLVLGAWLALAAGVLLSLPGAVMTRLHPKQGCNERASFGLDLSLCAPTATRFYNSLYKQARRTAAPINLNGETE